MWKQWKLTVCIGLALVAISCGKKDKKNQASQVQAEPIEEPINVGGANPTTPATTPAPVTTVTPLKYPLVFHHGFMDSSSKREENAAVNAAAKKSGATKIYYTEVSPANTIEFRAIELAKQIDEILAATKAAKVNILAHSFGGLDARYLISTLGYEDKVATLSTLSTPHRGTPVADAIIEYSPANATDWLESIFNYAGTLFNSSSEENSIDVIAAFENLTEEYMVNTFNPANPDSEDVVYQSWAGVSGFGTGHSIKKVLMPTFAALYLKGFDAAIRRKWLLGLSFGAAILFFIIRGINVYGDLVPWTVQKNTTYTILSFLNVTKYPPSLLYLLITIGPALLFLVLIENVKNNAFKSKGIWLVIATLISILPSSDSGNKMNPLDATSATDATSNKTITINVIILCLIVNNTDVL